MNKLDEGINDYLSGDVNSAIKNLNAYIDKGNTSNSQAYYYLGLAYSDIGKITDAGKFFQKALEIEPDKGAYHYRLALVYSQMMLFQMAIPHLIKTVEQNPEHVHAYNILGSIYFKNGDMDSAIEQYSKVVSISPEYAQGYYDLGNSYYYKGNIESAQKAFFKAISVDPAHRDAHYRMGRILSDAGDYDGAIVHMEQAFRLGMDEMPFLSHFALILSSKGMKDEALNIIEIAEERYPMSPELAKLKETI